METTSMGIWIPREIWNNEDLTVTEKLFIVKIQALDGEKGCYASNRYFSEFFKLSKSRCSAVIKNLKDKGYIAIHYAYEEGKNAIERRIIKIKKAVDNIVKTAKNLCDTKEFSKDKKEAVKNEIEKENENVENEIECLELSGTKRKRIRKENLGDITEVGEAEVKQLGIDNIEDNVTKLDINEVAEEGNHCDINEVAEEGIHLDVFIEETNSINIKCNSSNAKENSNNEISKGNKNHNNIDMNKNKTKKKKNNNKIIYEDIINYLNLKCDTNFKATTKKTIGCINARIREGNTLDDFKKVIDKKCEEWSNTTMSIYLRPETLFGTKFERYLTEDIKQRKNHFKKSNWTGGQANGKQFKNVRNSGENKKAEEGTRFGNITPLTAEEIERAERELF